MSLFLANQLMKTLLNKMISCPVELKNRALDNIVLLANPNSLELAQQFVPLYYPTLRMNDLRQE